MIDMRRGYVSDHGGVVQRSFTPDQLEERVYRTIEVPCTYRFYPGMYVWVPPRCFCGECLGGYVTPDCVVAGGGNLRKSTMRVIEGLGRHNNKTTEPYGG